MEKQKVTTADLAEKMNAISIEMHSLSKQCNTLQGTDVLCRMALLAQQMAAVLAKGVDTPVPVSPTAPSLEFQK